MESPNPTGHTTSPVPELTQYNYPEPGHHVPTYEEQQSIPAQPGSQTTRHTSQFSENFQQGIDNDHGSPELASSISQHMSPTTDNTGWSSCSQTPTAQTRFSHSPYPEVVNPYGSPPGPAYSTFPEVAMVPHLPMAPSPHSTAEYSMNIYSDWDPHQSEGRFVYVPHNHLGFNQAGPEKGGVGVVAPVGEKDDDNKRRPILGISLLTLILIVIVVLVLAIALGVGLGVGLKHKNPSGSKQLTVFGSTVLGSGISTGFTSTHIVVFQHSSGQLRYLEDIDLNGDNWSGGDVKSHIDANAKLPTPLAIIPVTANGVQSQHLFYISQTNIVQELVSFDNGTNWINGPLNNLTVNAMDSDNLSLQGCSFGTFTGIYLWVAISPTAIQQLEWDGTTNVWTPTEIISANGHANIGCYTWGSSKIEYLMPINFNNEVYIMWRDSANITSKWTNTSALISGVLPTTALGYTGRLFVQLNNGSIAGYNVQFDSDKTTVPTLESQYVIPGKAYAGTPLSVTGLNDGLAVFAHTNGTDITKNLLGNDNNWNITAMQFSVS